MRRFFLCVADMAMIAACSKAPAPAQANAAPPASAPATPAAPAAATAAAPAITGPAVIGTFTLDGKPAALTQATAHKDDPVNGQPITAIVFTEKDQGGDAQAADDAVFGNFGDAIVVKVQPDGTVIDVDVRHTALPHPGPVSISGVLTLSDYKLAGGVISGHLSTSGPVDVFDQKLNVNLTFHVAAPPP
jgi:hypothetical protein